MAVFFRCRKQFHTCLSEISATWVGVGCLYTLSQHNSAKFTVPFGPSIFKTEQRIAGKALKLLTKDDNATQFAACGLSTVGYQMQLEEIASGIPLVIGMHRKKPSVAEMRTLTDLNQSIYKAK